jgi:hypothetical protein
MIGIEAKMQTRNEAYSPPRGGYCHQQLVKCMWQVCYRWRHAKDRPPMDEEQLISQHG